MGACMEVHRSLGPGLTDHAYREAVARELRDRELQSRREVEFEVEFKGTAISKAVVADFIVEDLVALEVRSDPELTEADRHRLRRILTLSGLKTGMLVNFNVNDLRNGIARIEVTATSGAPAPRGSRPI